MANTIYVFGNGRLPFSDFMRLYAPAIERGLERHDTAWVVCDFRGVDTLTLEYLKDRTGAVTVFHVGERPRYLPDRHGNEARSWRMCGGFADDSARDAAALAACTHYLAVDRGSTPTRKSGTGVILENCRGAGKIAWIADADRALRLGEVRAQIDRAEVHPTARAFANILIELFPEWFMFAPEQFALLQWSMGLRLVVSGPGVDRCAPVVLITTSDSRNMTCAVHTAYGSRGEVANISMHYTPSEEHLARARDVISLALHALYPAMPVDPALIERVPAGKVFPIDLT